MKVKSLNSKSGKPFYLVNMAENREMVKSTTPLSLFQRVKRDVSYNGIFADYFGQPMRSSENFYILNEAGDRLIEHPPPDQIYPENAYDVISITPVDMSDKLLVQAVNPEVWKLFLKHKLASTKAAKAVREVACRRELEFDVYKHKGRPWYDDLVYRKEQSIWEVEKKNDFGWLCVASALLRTREWLAFFAFLTTIDTVVRNLIWDTVVDGVKLFRELFDECGIYYSEDGFDKFLFKDTPVKKLSAYQEKKGYTHIHKVWTVYAFCNWTNKVHFLKNFGYHDEELENCMQGRAVYPPEMCHLGSLEHLSFCSCALNNG